MYWENNTSSLWFSKKKLHRPSRPSLMHETNGKFKNFLKLNWMAVRNYIENNPGSTQYSGDIRWVFPQQCNVWDIQETFKEHFKGMDFLKSSQWKSCFCVKTVWFYDNKFDDLTNSSNHKVIFPVYSRNIPRVSVSKIFRGYPRNIVELWKHFLKSKSSKKMFVGYSVKILILAVSSLTMFFWTLSKLFYI